MNDKNGNKIKIGMELSGILKSRVGYWDNAEFSTLIKKGTEVNGTVVKSSISCPNEHNVLCLRLVPSCIMMPTISMIRRETREIISLGKKIPRHSRNRK